MAQIELLPEDKLIEALDFITYLVSWKPLDSNGQSKPAETVGDEFLSAYLRPEDDPLLKYIGGVEHGSLAQNLDEELYSYESLSGHVGVAGASYSLRPTHFSSVAFPSLWQSNRSTTSRTRSRKVS